jgi:hypothetical protein
MKPEFPNAPGLSLKPMKNGWQARWRARADLVARGYRPKHMRLWQGTVPSPVEQKWVEDRCQSLQTEMLVWGRGGVPTVAMFDGTLRSLMERYRHDPVSNFAKLEFCTRRYYDRLMGQLERPHGDCLISEVKGRDVHEWHQQWTEGGKKVSMGHALVGMLRTLVNFGDAMLDDTHCSRLATVLHKMRFENGRPRTVRITREQVIAICDAARTTLPMVALAQAIQFECTWRQKDVLGEWIPNSEPGVSEVLDGNMKWLKGLRWEEIDADLVAHHVTSKRKKLSEPDLKLAPLVMAELERMYINVPQCTLTRDMLPARGPVILDLRRGIPYYADDFREQWRKLATACGVPLNVQNRDARAGAISEAIAMGAEPAHVRDAATHSNLEQTYDYSRANRENTATVMALRAKQSKNGAA